MSKKLEKQSDNCPGVIAVDLDGTAMLQEFTDPSTWTDTQQRPRNALLSQLKLAQDKGYKIVILTARPLYADAFLRLNPVWGLMSCWTAKQKLEQHGIKIDNIYRSADSSEDHGLKAPEMKKIMAKEFGENNIEGKQGILLDDQAKQLHSVNNERGEPQQLSGFKNGKKVKNTECSIQAFDINSYQHVKQLRELIKGEQGEEEENDRYITATDKLINWLKQQPPLKELVDEVEQLSDEDHKQVKEKANNIIDDLAFRLIESKYRFEKAENSAVKLTPLENPFQIDVDYVERTAKALTQCLQEVHNKQYVSQYNINQLAEAGLHHKKSRKEKLANLLQSKPKAESQQKKSPFSFIRRVINAIAERVITNARHKRSQSAEAAYTTDDKYTENKTTDYFVNNHCEEQVVDMLNTLKNDYKKPEVEPIAPIEDLNDVEHIVFRGGGPKGFGHIGVIERLEQLEKEGKFNKANINKVGGSSIGAITAVGYGLGASAEKMQQRFSELLKAMKQNRTKKTDMSEVNGSPELKRRVSRTPGVFSGNDLYLACKALVWEQVTELLSDKDIITLVNDYNEKANDTDKITGTNLDRLQALAYISNPNYKIPSKTQVITFHDLALLRKLFPDTIKDIFVTGTNVTEKDLDIYSADTTPNMEVAKAAVTSARLPLVFRAEKRDGNITVDGGLISNKPLTPLKNVDGKVMACDLIPGYKMENKPESLVTQIQRNSYAKVALGINRSKFTKRDEQIANDKSVRGQYIQVNTPTEKYSSSDLNMPKKDQDKLVENGKAAVNALFTTKQINIDAIYNELININANKFDNDYLKYTTVEIKGLLLAKAKLEMQNIIDNIDNDAQGNNIEELDTLQQKIENSMLYHVLAYKRHSPSLLFKPATKSASTVQLQQNFDEANDAIAERLTQTMTPRATAAPAA